MENKETTALDYLFVFVKWRKFIFWFSFLSALTTAGISLLLPKWYTATSTILVPEDTGNFNISSIMSQLPNGGGFFDFDAESQRLLAIINSRNSHQHIAEKYQLQPQYKAQNIEGTIRALVSHVSFGFTKENAIFLSVEDRIPDQAKDMANEYISFLDKRNKELKTSQAKANREFIETRYNKTIEDLTNAEQSFKEFQQKTSVFSLPEQVAALIESAANIYAEKIIIEMELEQLKSDLGKNHFLVRQKQTELNSMSKQLTKFEVRPENFRDTTSGEDFLLPFKEVPELGMQYARLFRDVEIQNTILALMTEQLEFARLQEAKDTPTLQILDEAVSPIKRSSPKRTILVLIFGGLAFIFSLMLAFTFEFFSTARSRTPEEVDKLNAIKSMLGRAK